MRGIVFVEVLISSFLKHQNPRWNAPKVAEALHTPLQKANDTPTPIDDTPLRTASALAHRSRRTDVVIRADAIDIDIATFGGHRHLPILTVHAPI